MSAKKKQDNLPEPIQEPLAPVEAVWQNPQEFDQLTAGAILETKLRLIGVPFVITNVTYRPGAYKRRGEIMPDDYVSLEVHTAPEAEYRNVVRLREKAAESLPQFDANDFVMPESFVVVNDSSTGIKRQITGYLAHKGLVGVDADELPELNELMGALGTNVFDQNTDEWKFGRERALKGINTRLICWRGLRASVYEIENASESSVTFYLA